MKYKEELEIQHHRALSLSLLAITITLIVASIYSLSQENGFEKLLIFAATSICIIFVLSIEKYGKAYKKLKSRLKNI